MSAETVSAIFLRRIRFSETSLILTWFGRETGKIKAIAKGALRPGSAFAGKIDLFFRCDLTISQSQKSETHTLREVVVVEPFLSIRTDYLRTFTASYFTELVEEEAELARLLGMQMAKQTESSRQLIESLTRAPAARAGLMKQLGE